ncbi:MAG: hypothetical protein ABIP54_00320 [Candidatus Andersenbacteria bacterium]
MAKKILKTSKKNKPATQEDIVSVTDVMREIAGFIITEMRDGFQKSDKKIEELRLEEKLNWEKQWQFNKEIVEKVDLNTDSVISLDKRVRYQDDMPERLEHVENQQYALTRRVAVLENK